MLVPFLFAVHPQLVASYVLLAEVDTTKVAAVIGVGLGLASLYRGTFIDPRTSRLAERKENSDLRKEVDQLYADKRASEDRERTANRRVDSLEQKLEIAERRIASLTGDLDGARAEIAQARSDVQKWRLIAGEIRGQRFEREDP